MVGEGRLEFCVGVGDEEWWRGKVACARCWLREEVPEGSYGLDKWSFFCAEFGREVYRWIKRRMRRYQLSNTFNVSSTGRIRNGVSILLGGSAGFCR